MQPASLFLTIQVALALLTPAVWLRVAWSDHRAAQRWARRLWTAAWLAYLAHVAVAMTLIHHGSHAAAYEHTARRTFEQFGINTGAGLYVNYLFTLAWTFDVALWWRGGLEESEGAPWRRLAFDLFLLFMVANGAVVFAAGPARWLGVAVCGALVAGWTLRYTSRH